MLFCVCCVGSWVHIWCCWCSGRRSCWQSSSKWS